MRNLEVFVWDSLTASDRYLSVYDGATLQQLVDIHEMARLLKVSASWLYQRTRLRLSDIPIVRVGRYVRFQPQDVIDALKAKQTSSIENTIPKKERRVYHGGKYRNR